MIFRSSFFKSPKYSKFEYQPRYSNFDADDVNVEEIEEQKRIDFSRKRLPFSDSSIITGQLRRSSIAYRKKGAQQRKMRMFLILGLVIVLLLILLQNL